MATTVYLIRHAEGTGNIQHVFQGHTDTQLTENGQAQLEHLARRCREIPFDAIYSSPLIRTRQTAEAVNRYHNLPIQICPGIIEIDGGAFEGRRFDDLPQLYPEQYSLFEEQPHLFAGVDGESMAGVYERMHRSVLELVRANRGRTIAAVSHGCAIRNFLCWAQGMPLERIGEVPWLHNTSLSCVEFDSEDRPKLLLIDDYSHLPEGCVLFSRREMAKMAGNPQK